MTEISELNLVERVERNVERILAQNEELRQANAGLAAENARLEALTAAQKEEITSLRTQLDQLLLRKSVTEVSGGVRAAKIRINRLLKEVDRCIALMNK
ncbi:hypothetical protein [Millionella massiliensis]|uniref:hypothetical protein n=1 Tax=Millionella massiliensis TaxID=1871023 RepID=UPI0008DA8132|nr:hypothetical protein [Millionella massiliensis]